MESKWKLGIQLLYGSELNGTGRVGVDTLRWCMLGYDILQIIRLF